MAATRLRLPCAKLPRLITVTPWRRSNVGSWPARFPVAWMECLRRRFLKGHDWRPLRLETKTNCKTIDNAIQAITIAASDAMPSQVGSINIRRT